MGRAALLGMLVGASTAGAALAFQSRYEMTFWFDDEAAARAAGATSFGDHPCGAVALAPVAQMPAYDANGALEPELVVEYGDGRRELRRWSAPVDGSIWAVQGEEILVNQDDRFYWIGTDGRIRETRHAESTTPETSEGQCGTPAGQEGSDYAQCRVFRDAATRALRTLFFQAVCS
jgi:hypothetical protein